MIIAGNFKTNHTRSSVLVYCRALNQLLCSCCEKVYLFPPISALPYDDFAHLDIGIQNAYPIQSGAYTGEIGLEQISELGIKTIMIGHSERRTILGESDELCKRKFDFFAHAGFEIFLCVGENLQTRQRGEVEDFLKKQLKGIDLTYSRLVIAYEPIWAIGTGVSASLAEIEETHQILKSLGAQRVIYGGSVNEKNAQEIMNLESVDGVLVGGASLSVESFYQIIKQGEKQ